MINKAYLSLDPLLLDLSETDFEVFLHSVEFSRLCNQLELTGLFEMIKEGLDNRNAANWLDLSTNRYSQPFLVSLYQLDAEAFNKHFALIFIRFLSWTNRYFTIDALAEDLASLKTPDSYLNDIRTAWTSYDQSLKIKLNHLHDIAVKAATDGGTAEETAYSAIREKLLADSRLADILPTWIRDCPTLWSVRKTMQGISKHYSERRLFIANSIAPMQEKAGKKVSLIHAIEINESSVNEHFTKALLRANSDPAGAITAARSLLESVLKQILEQRNLEFDELADLPKLYKMCSRELNLAPDQHSEKAFKQILSGCIQIVDGLGTIRNKLSDAHGGGKLRVKPAPRHANLSVHLASAVSKFLLETNSVRKDDHLDRPQDE
jgi:Abortive infection C-terminus